ncbi:MAG: LLM class flavin-dependent oxidoreductase [Alphaproteobacteria bacterium]|nr:LLM class flavin-dependent oxidoreductase [Alphaproteobacteria bacterium]
MKELAAEYRRTIKTAMTLLPIIGETDADAERRWQHLQDGADREALDAIVAGYARKTHGSAKDRVTVMKRNVSFTGQITPGSPSTLADTIEELAADGGVDSIQLLFPDYIQGLKIFHAEVMPLLQRRELRLAS